MSEIKFLIVPLIPVLSIPDIFPIISLILILNVLSLSYNFPKSGRQYPNYPLVCYLIKWFELMIGVIAVFAPVTVT